MKKPRVPSPHSCNVLQVGTEFRRLWQFGFRNGQVSLLADRKVGLDEPLPPKVVAKDWSTLFQRKLNIAWLPADQLFLRVVHLPASDYQEVLSMVEVQLEKLSPMPVAQIVWSIELLPQQAHDLQTVIVIIAARDQAEAFLGKLELSGYLVDRLEIPCLHQLLAIRVERDSVCLFPSIQSGQDLCLVAWWYGGTLQQLQLLHLPEGEARPAFVIEQLTKTAWAGEVEGWLTASTRCQLVADATTAPLWEPALAQWSGQPVTVTEPLPEAKVGEVAAQRAARGESRANLLPSEYSVRYQQQFVDKLWMGGLGAVLGIYLVGVLIYLGALQILKFQYSRMENQVAAVSVDYTNAVRLKERIEVLENQLHLKYAALDCFKAISERLPADLTLVSFQFQNGQKVALQGTAPPDQTGQIIDYNDDLAKLRVEGQPLFSKVTPPTWVNRASVGGQTLAWNFTCELNRREIE